MSAQVCRKSIEADGRKLRLAARERAALLGVYGHEYGFRRWVAGMVPRDVFERRYWKNDKARREFLAALKKLAALELVSPPVDDFSSWRRTRAGYAVVVQLKKLHTESSVNEFQSLCSSIHWKKTRRFAV